MSRYPTTQHTGSIWTSTPFALASPSVVVSSISIKASDISSPPSAHSPQPSSNTTSSNWTPELPGSVNKLTHQTLKLFDRKMETHSGPKIHQRQRLTSRTSVFKIWLIAVLARLLYAVVSPGFHARDDYFHVLEPALQWLDDPEWIWADFHDTRRRYSLIPTPQGCPRPS